MTVMAKPSGGSNRAKGLSDEQLRWAEQGMRPWDVLDEGERAAVAATYADLGTVPEAVFRELLTDPAYGRYRDHRQADLPENMRPYAYPQQSWPSLVGTAKLERLWQATHSLISLVRSIPERIFDNDPQRIAEVYPVADPMLVSFALEEPSGLDEGVVRVDLLDDGDRLVGLELNMGAFLGGWQCWFWTHWWRTFEPVAEVLGRRDAGTRAVNPILNHLRHSIDAVLRTIPDPGSEINLLVVVESRFLEIGRLTRGVLNGFYREALEERGLEGELFVDSYASTRLRRRGGRLWYGDRALRAVFQYASDALPADVFRAFKGREVCLFNPPIYRWLGDKGNLAVLSMHDESDVFTAEERRRIRDHVPWSRKCSEGAVTYRGEREDLRRLLLGNREFFVVKAGLGSQGDGVVVGPKSSPEEWRRGVETAMTEPGWLAQEFIASRPYLFQCGRQGNAVCDLVWGIFCSGQRYGGGFTRMLPRHLVEDGIINSARGAQEALVLEADDGLDSAIECP